MRASDLYLSIWLLCFTQPPHNINNRFPELPNLNRPSHSQVPEAASQRGPDRLLHPHAPPAVLQRGRRGPPRAVRRERHAPEDGAQGHDLLQGPGLGPGQGPEDAARRRGHGSHPGEEAVTILITSVFLFIWYSEGLNYLRL